MGNSQNRPVRDKIFDLFFKYPVNAKIEKIVFLVPNLKHYSSNLKTQLV